ncbi:MAG: c-type cytochrome [Pontibacterium sp.]
MKKALFISAATLLMATNALADRSGEEVYKAACLFCHAQGVMNAPKYGDAKAWEPRIAQGMDALYNSALNGKGQIMQPRGGCMNCTDNELKAAVDYMVKSAK